MTRFGAIVLTIVVALLMVSCAMESDASKLPPAIASVSPSSVAAGSSDFTLAVTGTNFGSRSVVLVNGSPRATTFISKTQLTARILSADVSQAGTVQLSVSGGAVFVSSTSSMKTVSNSFPLNVTAAQPLQVATSSLPAATVQILYTTSMALSGGKAPYNWKVASGQLPPGIGLDSSSGMVTGVPSQTGQFKFAAQVTDSSSPAQTASSSPLSLDVMAGISPLVMSSATLPNGTVQVAYSASLSASGGTQPYVWSVTSGSLPAGLSLASSGSISGTPSVAGSSTFTVQVRDSAASPQTATHSFSISVVAPPANLAVSTTSLPQGTAGQSYAASLQASGGTPGYTWSVTSGSLPAGLSLASSGAISGTPSSAGSSTFTVQVKDSASAPQSATQSLTLSVSSAVAPLSINSFAPPGGITQASYSSTISATGGVTPYTWSVASGSLPTGLSFNVSTGSITGTPTTTGTFNFTLQVRDSSPTPQSASKSASIQIVAPLKITTTSLPTPQLQASYSVTLGVSGGMAPYVWSVASGSLPVGLSLNSSTGVLSGTPTTAGNYSFTIRVDDPPSIPQTASQPFSANVPAAVMPLQITTASLPGGQVQAAYSTTLVASGGTSPYAWSISSGSLPAGLSLSSSGAISGTPSSAGSSTFNVQAKDSAASQQAASASLTLTVSPAPAPAISAVSPNSGPTAGGTLVTISGSNFKAGASVLFGAIASPNVLVSSATQIQATTPALAAGTVNVSVRNSDGQSATSAGAFTFGQGLLITTSSLPNGTLNSSYSASLAAAGGSTPYTWSYSGIVPHCVDFNTSGQFSGTPCVAGTYAFTMMATDASGASTTKQFNIIISGPVLVITTTSLPAPTQSTPYSATLQASGGTPPFTWSILSGQLPSGLTLNPSTGTISGTPTATGSFSFTAQVNDVASAQASAPFSLTVSPPGAVTITTTSLLSAQVNQPYSAALQATGGTPSYAWSVASGSLPPGLSLMASGQIMGTPSATGTFNFTVKVTDAAAQPQTATQALSLTVSSSPTLDQYGGLATAPCVGGAKGLFYVEKGSNGRWHFCTADGNVFFMQGIYTAGLYNSSAALPKYGNSTDTYRQQTVLRMKSWGFNALSIYWLPELMPISWGGGSPNPQKMPFVHFFGFADKAKTNRYGVGTHPVKEINNGTCTNPPAPHKSCNHALGPWGKYWDFFDPAFAAYANSFAKTTSQNQGSYPADFPTSWATGKQWVIGFVPDDSDNLAGFSGPGPEYPGRDATVHPHPGHVIATAPPVQTNNGYMASIGCLPAGSCNPYSDTTVYSKNAWRDYLIGKYGTIGALNAAWGSNYTTFGVDLGYPAGTTGSRGVLDEDGSGPWIGSDVYRQTGANANVKTDLDAFLQLYAEQYYGTVAAAIRAANPGMLVFSNAPMNSHAGMTRRPVLRAAGKYLDVIEVQHDPTRAVVAQETFKETGRPMVTWTGFIAPNDSSVKGGADAYLVFTTQSGRGTAYTTEMTSKTQLQAYDGSYPYIGTQWWSWMDGSENWGLVSFLDNAYDGKEAVVPTSRDPWGYPTGGEPGNYGNFLTNVQTSNFNVMQKLLGLMPW
jgi:hypothetical protein